MYLSEHQNRLVVRAQALIALGSMIALMIPTPAFAAETVELELRPHCTDTGNDGEVDWIFGPIPAPGIVIDTDVADGLKTYCPRFQVEDPQTLRTEALREGDILDMNIVVQNPEKADIKRVRSWLSYDPTILEGEFIEVHPEFETVTPGESDFSPEDGYVQIEASTEGSGIDSTVVLFARVQFRVLMTSPAGTMISFYDVTPEGHSTVVSSDAGEDIPLTVEEPGVLRVVFVDDGSSNDDSSLFDADTDDDMEEDMNDAECTTNDDCSDGVCVAGICQEEEQKLANGETCTFDAQCESGLCASGLCIPPLGDEPENDIPPFEFPEESELEPTPAPQPTPTQTDTQKTAFSLLQIQNVRVTTEGSSVFLAWDPLQSSQLQSYNVYYGTISGRYIQRRMVPADSTSLTLRALTSGTQYFFAVRGISTSNEESAFSREVAVTVGSPSSSTSPLSGNFSSGTNPLASASGQVVPGETGAPSTLALLILASAVIGTFMASRRQFVVSASDHS